jgi:hypothetical protein
VRSFVFLILLILSGVATTAAQASPPSPVLYSAPAASEIQTFTAPDKSFSASFPGKPEVEEKMMGNAKVSSFRVYRKGSNTVIGITDFMRDISGNPERVFKMVRDRMLLKPDSKIASEKDIKLDSHAGKEFVIDSGYVHRISRVFIVRERIYEVYIDVTNWNILAPTVVSSFEKEATRFLDSFRLVQSNP